MSSSKSKRLTTFEEIMSKNIVFCQPEDSIPQIAKLMRDKWTDTAFVKNDAGEVEGIITDGIIWDLVAKEKDPREYIAKDVMYKTFITVDAEKPFYSLEEFRDLVDKSKVKRVAVRKDGEIVGVVKKKILGQFKRISRHFNVVFT